MRWLAAALLALVVLLPVPAALAGARVALVLAAEDYTAFVKSPIAARSTKEIAAALEQHGFEVAVSENPTNSVSRAALRDFAQKTAGADAAIVVLSGHGAAAGGLTYFLPVNTEIARDTDLFSRGLALPGVAQIAARAKVGAILFIMTAANIPSTLQSISPRPSFTGLAPNVVAAFSTSDKVPTSRIDLVSQQALADLLVAAKQPKLKLSAMVTATAAGGLGKVFGEVTDPDFTRPASATSAASNGADAERLRQAEERARLAEDRARQAESEAMREHMKAAQLVTGDARPGEDTQKLEPVAALRVVEGLISSSQRRAIQVRLRERGYYKGPIDAVFGDLTRQAIRDYQRELSAEATGYLTPVQLTTLMRR
jgi:hypothetical protein